MSPEDYRKPYDELIVPIAGGLPETIRLNKYRLHPNNVNGKEMSRFETMPGNHGINRQLGIHNGTQIVDVGTEHLVFPLQFRSGIEPPEAARELTRRARLTRSGEMRRFSKNSTRISRSQKSSRRDAHGGTERKNMESRTQGNEVY